MFGDWQNLHGFWHGFYLHSRDPPDFMPPEALHGSSHVDQRGDICAVGGIARGGPDAVVPLLKELGYDGLGGGAGDAAMAGALEAAGLRYFNGYLTLSFDSAQPGLDDRLREILVLHEMGEAERLSPPHRISLAPTRAVRPEIDTRIVAAVTESLPNLEKRNPPKTVDALESCIHAASKANGRRKPYVVMKCTDDLHSADAVGGGSVSAVVQASVCG
jgi:hypothetical protein